MNNDPGHDIGPDEIVLPSEDLQMDLVQATEEQTENSHTFYTTSDSSEENNISSMPTGYTQHHVYGTNRTVWTRVIEEPLDMTPSYSNSTGHDAAEEPMNVLECNPLYEERNRLQTFCGNWPPQAPVSPEDLARNGFYFEGPGDRVRCVYCSGVLKNWEPTDTVEGEHQSHFPYCSFHSLGTKSGGPTSNSAESMPHSDSMGVMPQFSDQTGFEKTSQEKLGIVKNKPKYPRYALESDRLATFKSWPSQMKQKPEDLARAGLFYLGNGDRVKCFTCDGTLHSWEPNDDPMAEHARWFPECAFVKLANENTASCQNGVAVAVTKDSETSASVQALIDNGYTLEAISNAISKLHIDGVAEDEIPPATKILQTILDTDGEETCSRGTTAVVNGHGRESDNEVKALLDENRELKEQRLCKICLENEISVIFLPCGHLASCGQCATSLSECPICRAVIRGTAKAFWA